MDKVELRINVRNHRKPKTMLDNKMGAELIADERQRQIEVEGYKPENDERHNIGELCSAAACYLWAADCLANAHEFDQKYNFLADGLRDELLQSGHGQATWPWDSVWLKLSEDPIRNLVKAGALIAAEIDRLQRLKTKTV